MILVPLFNFALRKLSDASRSRSLRFNNLGSRLRDLRRQILPTDKEIDRHYLEEAGDLHDLEWRMRELDRPRRHARWPLNPFD
jgi:Protein of unknown function (DUF3563)